MAGSETIVGLGAKTDYVAVVPNVDPARLRLTPDEGAVFACVGRGTQIQEVISKCGLSEPKAIAMLLALRAKGAIVPAKITKGTAGQAAMNAAMLEEIDLDPARKKEILDLERSVDSANHFEILGVRPNATQEQIKAAFYEISRRYHPDKYFNKNLGSFRARIERIFRRMTEAMAVLEDEQKRLKYLEANPDLALAARPDAPTQPQRAEPKTAVDEAREAERRARFAKHPYLAKASRITELVNRAKAQIAKGDYGKAFTDLHMASQIEPRNTEVAELLAEARKKNDVARAGEEVKKAEEAEAMGNVEAALSAWKTASMLDGQNPAFAAKVTRLMMKVGADAKEIKPFAQRAVDGDPRNPDYRALLGTVLLEAGMKALAQKQFEEALKLDPNHAEAKKHVKKWWSF